MPTPARRAVARRLRPAAGSATTAPSSGRTTGSRVGGVRDAADHRDRPPGRWRNTTRSITPEPDTAFGNVKAGVREHFVPGYERGDFAETVQDSARPEWGRPEP
ncbi:hypothetical protein [Streptomyces enissocaesilis]|uniref:Uncharacterized protein n=1 Tax=Streptomyces enissocaesilis TaxID=332589 RepID=A0ABN3XJW4_9ACTN